MVLKVILVESFILGFIFSGGGFLVFMIVGRKLIDGVFLLNCVIDIFYFVRKKRKLEEESFWKDDVKKVKLELEVNGGSGDVVFSGNEVLENMEEEVENWVESWVVVEVIVEVGVIVGSIVC